jgi:TPR repeat protein
MLLAALALAAAAPLAQNPPTEISAETRAIAVKHGIDIPAEGVSELERLAAGGDKSAAALLAEFLTHQAQAPGLDWTRACDVSEQAGQFPTALHNLANCHYYGNGRPKDLAKARTLYGQAMDLGLAKSACALGNMLIAGHGGDKDVARGLDLCRRGADAGDPDAQTDYGGYVLTGEGMARDSTLARRYLTLAAEKKQRNAAFLLGQIYWNGDGVGSDRKEAVRWWTVAFEAGRPDAARLIAAEAIARIDVAVKANRKPPADAVADAGRWLKISAERDPDSANRAKAAQLLELLPRIAKGPGGD